MRPAVFLDRDGTINEQMGYINHISRFHLIPGAAKAIGLLNRHDYLVIVISNQSGIARGYFPLELVHEVHRHMIDMLKKEGAHVDAIYFCAHSPDENCSCRKPKTGLIDQACRDLEIDLSRSYVIGDMCTDMELARNAGLNGIMVKTGYGMGEMTYRLPKTDIRPIFLADDLLSAVRWILNNDKGH